MRDYHITNFNTKEELKSVKNLLSNFNSHLKIHSPKDKKEFKQFNFNSNFEITDNSESFLKEYNSGIFEQYSDLYYLRLKQMKKNLFEKAKNKWINIPICKNVVQLEPGVI